MEITTKQLKRCDIVSVDGRIDSQTAPHLAEALKGILDENRFRIVLDMEKVEFTSSAGLRVFIDVQKTCKRWNRGELVLAAVPERIYDALSLAGFTEFFTIYEDVLEAVGSF
jgi:anti-sigma B factor antagonist